MKKWDELSEELQCEEILPYYKVLEQHKFQLVLKRIFDFIMGCILLVILLPLFVLIGILVGVTSKGGVFFCQTRVTTYGKTFRIYKFRTMVVNADKVGSQVTTKADSRITKVGRFLRKVRLDEIPQLINIILGDMSFVGTRPEVEKYVEMYTNIMKATLLMPAGVTSVASIEFKDEETLLANGNDVDRIYKEEVLPEKMKYNLDYILNFSLKSDIVILFKTVIAVLH